jgi:hypothetical protein
MNQNATETQDQVSGVRMDLVRFEGSGLRKRAGSGFCTT